MGDGSHLDVPGVQTIPVTDLRIEPSPLPIGFMTIDGEKVKYGPIHASVMPSKAKILVR